MVESEYAGTALVAMMTRSHAFVHPVAARSKRTSVSVVGAGMKSHPGVARDVFKTLGEHGINIEMISTSPIKISCVIAAERVADAVRALHETFGLGEDAVREEDPSGEHRPRVTS